MERVKYWEQLMHSQLEIAIPLKKLHNSSMIEVRSASTAQHKLLLSGQHFQLYSVYSTKEGEFWDSYMISL